MNADIMIENAEPASCKTMRAEAEIKRDRFAQQLAAWECLRFFENTPVVEVDFQRRFVEMPDDDVTLLKAFYNIKTDAELLKMICRFWNVRIRHEY